MNLTIFGTGYVGLVTGTCFAQMGNHVTCVDVDADKIAQLQQGRSPIYEPGLGVLLKENIQADRMVFTLEPREAIETADIIFYCSGDAAGRGWLS